MIIIIVLLLTVILHCALYVLRSLVALSCEKHIALCCCYKRVWNYVIDGSVAGLTGLEGL